MLLFEPSAPWPSSTPENLPEEGASWLTVARAPVPYIGIRERGSQDWFRAWVGKPFPLDPKKKYQIRNIANPSIDLDNVPGPTVASRAFLVRSTVLVLSEHPVDGGSMFLAFSLTKIQAAAVVLLPMRFTTDGLRGVQAHVDSSGVITSAGLYSFDPDAAAPAEFSSLSALSASSAIVGFNPLAQAYNGSTYFPLTMPRGANIYASLPITQTPTLFVRIRGFVS